MRLFRSLILLALLQGHAPGKARIHVVATGCTIAHTSSGHIRGEDLVRALPGLSGIAEVSVEQFSNIGSEYMTPALWKGLPLRLQTLGERPDLHGIVVTHGTDTMEE